MNTTAERESLEVSGTMGSAPALEIAGLQAWYGESHILHGVDLTVNRGEVVTLLGRNGAGRTTTLRAIMGLTGRRTGSIRIGGRETINLPTHRIAHCGIGYCPEERGIFSSLSCEENLLLPPPVGDKAHMMSLEEIYAMFPNLHERRMSQADTITVLQRGEVLAEGNYAEVSKNPLVMQAYMGSADAALAGAHA